MLNKKTKEELIVEINKLRRQNDELTNKLIKTSAETSLYKKQYEARVKQNTKLTKDLNNALKSISMFKSAKEQTTTTKKTPRKRTSSYTKENK